MNCYSVTAAILRPLQLVSTDHTTFNFSTSTSMSDSRLPEELLRDILALLLCPTVRSFTAFPQVGWDSRKSDPARAIQDDSEPASSDLLLASKSCLRVGTPLLYTSLYLSNAVHTNTVAQLLKTNPHIGKAIRHLRLDGGMGRDRYTIIKHAPRIHTIHPEARDLCYRS